MDKSEKKFYVKWQTGCIFVYVYNFFSQSKQADINKLLKLAKVNCTDDQRIALLADLEETKQNHPHMTSSKLKRIEGCIAKIKAQKWERTC